MDRMQDDETVPIAELLDERRRLLDVAYWMLGRSQEADDDVAEAYRRWYDLSDDHRIRIAEPRSWLVTTVGGICLERLTLTGRSHPGPDGAAPPQDVDEEVSQALLDALDRLSPAERAAFVLNDVFGMAPGTVAAVVGQTEEECDELAARARHSLATRRAHPTTPQQHDRVVRAVRQACVTENPAGLTSLLAPDATVFFDGGGKVRTLPRPVHGAGRVTRSMLTLLAGRPRTTLHCQSVNGRTGIVVRYGDQVAAVISLDVAGDRVVQIWAVLNPDKLRHWNRTATQEK
ncbi:sigma factor [Streptomyces sp. RP5T]|uniref:sigma factor n=1 Tax=Streptomyces sp. RP5T TaxID=2490848 RepID=UPI000F646A0D|nr:sigma factor [Streptomyces sp. RP5T]RRR84788.1 RNA polymerase subunit sigma [Streptomyces sp. RP5T]